MKKFAATAVLIAIAGAASAQSSVTLFGVVDASAKYVKNGDNKQKTLGTNGINSSRFGVRGIEDLGGGLKAGFWLESGFNPDTGAQSDSSRFFNRRSTVSLIGGFGELRLGRDYTPSYYGFADYDAFGTNGVGDSSKFQSNLGSTEVTDVRADNAISYFLPKSIGSLYGQVMVAAGEGTSGKKYVGGRVGYAAGPFDVSGSYAQTTVTANASGDDKYKVAILGASYDLAMVKLSGYYSQTKWGDLKLGVWDIGATAPIGQGRVRASYVHANASGVSQFGADTGANDADQFALGYIYDLSKRTAVYTSYARVKNKGNATFTVASSPALLPGATSQGLEVGLRHSF